MTRMSTRRGAAAPTGRISRASRTRSSRACTSGAASPTSSRNSTPRSALANRPSRAVAPLKAPFVCPKSSPSTSVGGRAARFTATSGPERLAEWAWMARAASSLPVPVAPVMSTGRSLEAASATRAKTRCMTAELPTRPPGGGAVAAAVAPRSRSRSTIAVTCPESNGLTRYSAAPASTARTAVSRSPKAVMTTIRAVGTSARKSGIAESPSRPGRRTSRRMSSGANRREISSASSALAAIFTACPRSSRSSPRLQPIAGSSSTIKMRFMGWWLSNGGQGSRKRRATPPRQEGRS